MFRLIKNIIGAARWFEETRRAVKIAGGHAFDKGHYAGHNPYNRTNERLIDDIRAAWWDEGYCGRRDAKLSAEEAAAQPVTDAPKRVHFLKFGNSR